MASPKKKRVSAGSASWTNEESLRLFEIWSATKQTGKVHWNDIIRQLESEFPDFEKTPKQCRSKIWNTSAAFRHATAEQIRKSSLYSKLNEIFKNEKVFQAKEEPKDDGLLFVNSDNEENEENEPAVEYPSPESEITRPPTPPSSSSSVSREVIDVESSDEEINVVSDDDGASENLHAVVSSDASDSESRAVTSSGAVLARKAKIGNLRSAFQEWISVTRELGEAVFDCWENK